MECFTADDSASTLWVGVLQVGVWDFERRVVSESLHGRLVRSLFVALKPVSSLHSEFVFLAHHFFLAGCSVVSRMDFLSSANTVNVRRVAVLVATEHGSETLRLVRVFTLSRNLAWLFLAGSVVVAKVA